MFLVLRRSTQDRFPPSPVGWEVALLSGAATPKEAAGEAGDTDLVAVLEWSPEYYGTEIVRSVTKLTGKQAEAKLLPPESATPELSGGR